MIFKWEHNLRCCLSSNIIHQTMKRATIVMAEKFPDFSLTLITNYKIPRLATKFPDFPWLWERLESPWIFPDRDSPVFACLLYYKYMWFLSQLSILLYSLYIYRTVTCWDIWKLHWCQGISNHQLLNSTVCSTDCLGKHQSLVFWPFVRRIHRLSMVSPHKKQ